MFKNCILDNKKFYSITSFSKYFCYIKIDEDIIYSLNKDNLELLSSLYHSNNVSLLAKLVSKWEES